MLKWRMFSQCKSGFVIWLQQVYQKNTNREKCTENCSIQIRKNISIYCTKCKAITNICFFQIGVYARSRFFCKTKQALTNYFMILIDSLPFVLFKLVAISKRQGLTHSLLKIEGNWVVGYFDKFCSSLYSSVFQIIVLTVMTVDSCQVCS